MKKALTAALAGAMVLATAALAHQGVQNAAVKARMDGMSAIGANMKTLGAMAKGQVAFDAGQAREAAAAVAEEAARIPSLFEAQEADPKSEALPLIWTEFDRFTAIAHDLEAAATAAASALNEPEDLGPALKAIGGQCSACHKAYRE
ncbi:MAG: c-type cytochrome [Paracoccaceae bacterium]